MSRIVYVKSARKEHKCSKCGKVIEKGQPYKKGQSFRNTIVVCKDCPLKSYEVYSSPYSRNIGEIVEDWASVFGNDSSVPEAIAGRLTDIMSDLEYSLENLPDGLREVSTGELLQNRIDQVNEAIDMLGAIDYDSIREDAKSQAESNINRDDCESDAEYEEVLENETEDIATIEYESKIEDALSILEY